MDQSVILKTTWQKNKTYKWYDSSLTLCPSSWIDLPAEVHELLMHHHQLPPTARPAAALPSPEAARPTTVSPCPVAGSHGGP